MLRSELVWILRCPLCQEIVESHTTGIQGWNILETGITVRVIKAHHVVKRISEHAEDQKFSSWYYVKNPGKSLLEVNKWKMLVEACFDESYIRKRPKGRLDRRRGSFEISNEDEPV